MPCIIYGKELRVRAFYCWMWFFDQMTWSAWSMNTKQSSVEGRRTAEPDESAGVCFVRSLRTVLPRSALSNIVRPLRTSPRCAYPNSAIVPFRRGFELLLNKAWSGAVTVGRWISFDEQMVLCVGRSAKFMMKHMPKKPIKNGMCL